MQKVSVAESCFAQFGGGSFTDGLELGDIFSKFGIVRHDVDVERGLGRLRNEGDAQALVRGVLRQ